MKTREVFESVRNQKDSRLSLRARLILAVTGQYLALIGIELPWPELVQTYAPLVVYQLLILLLYWWRGSQIQLTYACFYEAALPEDPETV